MDTKELPAACRVLSLLKIKSVRIDGAAHQGQAALRYARRAERAVEPAHPCLMRDAFGVRAILEMEREPGRAPLP